MMYYYVSFKDKMGKERYGIWRYAENPDRAVYLADVFFSLGHPTRYNPDYTAVVERETDKAASISF